MAERPSVHMAHGRTKEQLEVMRRIKEEDVDPFDWNLLSTYHVQPTLHKGEYWLITPNDYPYEGTQLHLLFIYRDRAPSLAALPAEAWIELQKSLVWIESKYTILHGALLMRFGDPSLSGASVDHLHMHVIVGGNDSRAEKLKAVVGYKHT